MSIFSIFKSNSLRPSWTHRCDGVLWRILFSRSGHLVGEVRNPQNKTTSFFCLHDQSGDAFWTNKTFDETWWIGIEDVTENHIYFHRFYKPDMPQHRGIIACEIDHGQQVWEDNNYAFLFALNGKIYVVKEGFEDRKFYALHGSTGSIAEDLGNDVTVINNTRASINEEERFKDFLYPSAFDETRDDFQFLSHTIYSHVNKKNLVGAIDYLSLPKKIILSWHERINTNELHQEKMQQSFKIIDTQSAKVLFEETLNKNIITLGTDSFFIKDTMLYFIKELTTLTAINLRTF